MTSRTTSVCDPLGSTITSNRANYCYAYFALRKAGDKPPTNQNGQNGTWVNIGATVKWCENSCKQSSDLTWVPMSPDQINYDLEEATRGTQYAATLKPYQRAKNGRAASNALISQHAGKDKWEKELTMSPCCLYSSQVYQDKYRTCLFEPYFNISTT